MKADLGDFGNFPRARKGLRLQVMVSRAEVKAVLDRMSGPMLLMARLLYGTGMRLNELLRLRVQDLQFDQNQIVVFEGVEDQLPARRSVRIRAACGHMSLFLFCPYSPA